MLVTSSLPVIDSDIDPLLAPFVTAGDEESAREALGELLDRHASPLIRRIVRCQLGPIVRPAGGGADLDDVHATVLLRLTAHCRQLRQAESESRSGNGNGGGNGNGHRNGGGSGNGAAIVNLASYVAATTYNTCHEWLRTRAPRRTRLQNRVRYVLTRDATLAFWEAADREWWCSARAHMTPQSAISAGARAFDEVARAVQQQMAVATARTRARTERTETADTPRLVVALVQGTLAALGAPCRVADLVSALAEALGETDVAAAPTGDHLADRSVSPHAALEHRDYLTRLWSEIVQLPVRQRVALLLNLRDEHGGGILALFPLTGVASAADIARALDMSDAALAELWPTLPRDDHGIAAYLGVTRRQVINLRKCARARLARRMSGGEG